MNLLLRTAGFPEPGAPESLEWSLLTAALATHAKRIGADNLSGVLKDKETLHALSVLPDSSRRRFQSWVTHLSAEDLRRINDIIRASSALPEELFNWLADRLFLQESAKAKGAIFTPKWLTKRLVQNATKHWVRLNPGTEPTLAADLSCGPGAFLAELGHQLPRTRVIGVDNTPEYVALARLLTKQFRNVEVHCTDTLLALRSFGQLTLTELSPSVPSNGYDIVVGNPPYVRCQLLNSGYSKALRELYPEFAIGNFDLATLFLAQTLEALRSGGIAALVVSSKFMTSRYGAEICRRMGQRARLLEIVDFGDGQVFEGRTTYTCTLTFAKLPPSGNCKVLKFPPGLKWTTTEAHMSRAELSEIPVQRFQAAPWDLSSGQHDEILQSMRKEASSRLLDLFPNVSQGIRTGANQFFIVPLPVAKELEQELVFPYISGEHVRPCRILASNQYLIWPYRYTAAGAVVPILERELERDYPRTAAYFNTVRVSLAARKLDSSVPWYAYSRSQNLDLANRPKLIARELLPRSEFAADFEGRYAICSGYALLAPPRMSRVELGMWAAVMSTSTMEFQLRHASTQLHSGWFRILKQHLKRVCLPSLSGNAQSQAEQIATRLHQDPANLSLWDDLDNVVSRAFGLTDAERRQILSHIDQHHSVSLPNALFEQAPVADNGIPATETVANTSVLAGHVALPLSRSEKDRYLPVELPRFYQLHSDRDNLARAVTFAENKHKPIYRWYNFTQGFSSQLVTDLLAELGASKHSRVYDPFVGSGTTLLASQENGIASFGAEISPFLCWIARLKTTRWDTALLRRAVQALAKCAPAAQGETPTVFASFFQQAYSPKVLQQIIGWRNQIEDKFETPVRDFLLLGLVSILEEVSQLRKHGSHYRFLNKTDSVGLAKLNIPIISSDAELKPILIDRLRRMIDDIDEVRFPSPAVPAEVFNVDSRHDVPTNRTADIVVTSPPYLNRNMYFAQQKAELVLLRLIADVHDYRALVRRTFRSHVEGDLPQAAKSDIPEVQAIVDRIHLSENNNAKIPQMVCCYFADLRDTLANLRRVLAPSAQVAFVVGNCRWGGVVVPVDHLLAMLAEQLGYKPQQIIVTRLKGNSPQQMRRYGKIPLRESIVLLTGPDSN